MGYTRAEQLAAREAVRPAVWARLAVSHTKKTCVVAFIVPVAALAVVLALDVFTLASPNKRDFLLREDVRTRMENARDGVRKAYPFGTPRSNRSSSDLTTTVRGGSRIGSADLAVLFKTKHKDKTGHGPGVLTRENVAQMKEIEDLIVNDERYGEFCFFDPKSKDCNGNVLACSPPSSILSHPQLYGRGEVGKGKYCRKPGAQLVSEEQWELFLNELFVDDGKGGKKVGGDYAALLGKDVTFASRKEGGPSTAIVVSRFVMGGPYKGYSSINDRPGEQLDAYVEWSSSLVDRVNAFSTTDMDVRAIGEDYADGQFASVLLRDVSFAGASILTVFLVIWIHTTSLMLACFAMLQIVLAFPLTYAVYRLILQIKYFAYLQVMSIFLILGIAADDVAVFTDAWAQAAVVLGSDVDLITRMSWTYRRAVKAMSVTSVTTAAAFFVTATSRIMPIATLGIWAGVLVLVQFLFVICMYPSAIVGWHRFWRERHWKNCLRKKVDTDEDEDPPADIEETQPEEIQGSTPVHVPMCYRCLPEKWRPKPVAKGTEGEYRTVERFFNGPWVNMIRKLRFVIIALAIALASIGVYLATLLEPPEKTEELLPLSNPIRAAVLALQESFPAPAAVGRLNVVISWGISDTDYSGVSKYSPRLNGKVVLDDSFDLKPAASQKAILDACKTFGENEKLVLQGVSNDSDRCWVADFKKWRNEVGKGDFETYDTDKDLVSDILSFGDYTDEKKKKPHHRYLASQRIVLTSSLDRVIYSEIYFVSPERAAKSHEGMWSVYFAWQEELKKVNDAAPEGANHAVATAGYPWQWQVTQSALVRAVFQGTSIMLVVALISLAVITCNWVVAILATLCIGGVVSNLLGLVYLLGWRLGITESIAVVFSIGYAFDGVAHVCTAYVESKSKTRFDRTRDALTDLGISILAGGISTLVAGSFLFFAVIIIFVKFGGFIVSTVILSFLWSLLFFPAILQTIGPVEKVGSLAFMGAPIRRWAGRLGSQISRKRDSPDGSSNSGSIAT